MQKPQINRKNNGIYSRKLKQNMDKNRLTAALANGAEYLAMGEIAAHTGLLVSQAPRNNANYDIIVNSHDLRTGCRVEVKHSRSGFKANIKGSEYDFLVFIYAPSDIESGIIFHTAEREIYVFPRHVVEATDRGKTGVNFNPRYVNGFEWYLDGYSQILEHVSRSDAKAEFPENILPQMRVIGTRGDGLYLVDVGNGRRFVADFTAQATLPKTAYRVNRQALQLGESVR